MRLIAALPALGSLALSLLLAGCPPPPKPGPTPTPAPTPVKTDGTETPAPAATPLPAGAIKVGQVVALTGEVASFGNATNNGTMLAVEEINASGMLGEGVTLELISLDDQSTPTGASTAAKKLISENQVVALLGEVASKNSLAIAPIAEENEVPQISPSSTNPDVTNSDWVFRACYLDTFQGQVMARFAAKGLGKKTGAILFDSTNAYSVGLKDAVTAEFTAQGGTIAATEAYQAGDSDFRSLITKIQAGNPDVVFLPGYATDTALIIAQAKEAGLAGPFVGGDGWDMPELLGKGGQAVEGTYFTTHYVETDPDPKVQSFVSAYKAKYGGQVPDAMAALGYDSTYMLADALKRAGSTEGAALREAIAATKGFMGVTGAITLDPKGDPQKGIVIIEIKGGQRVLHSRLDEQGNPAGDAAPAPVTNTPEGESAETEEKTEEDGEEKGE